MSALDPLERDLVKCEDMRIYAERARKFLGSRSFEEFQNDQLVQEAIIRCVELIGEAARSVSEETQNRSPDIPWPLITGMRNILAHEYGTVDLEEVYDVVDQKIPELLTHLRPLIEELEQEVNWEEDS